MSATVAALALAGCGEADEGELEGETPTAETTDTAGEARTDVPASAGAAQHPPPEGAQGEAEPSELPEDQAAGAAQHPPPGEALPENEE